MLAEIYNFPLADPSTDAHNKDMSCGQEARARRGYTDLSRECFVKDDKRVPNTVSLI
jgi:hypothetical protein